MSELHLAILGRWKFLSNRNGFDGWKCLCNGNILSCTMEIFGRAYKPNLATGTSSVPCHNCIGSYFKSFGLPLNTSLLVIYMYLGPFLGPLSFLGSLSQLYWLLFQKTQPFIKQLRSGLSSVWNIFRPHSLSPLGSSWKSFREPSQLIMWEKCQVILSLQKSIRCLSSAIPIGNLRTR